jgi:hypothetical protein
MRMRLLTTAVLASAALLAGCDKSGTGTTDADARLSQADLASLNRAILGVGAGVAQGGATGNVSGDRSAAAAPASGTFTYNLDATAPCVPSGSVGVKGTLGAAWDGTAQTAQLQAAFAVAHHACRVATDDGGTIEITGTPDIDFTLNAAAAANKLTSLRITESGAFGWSKGASSGTCTVDLTAELVPGTQNQMRLTGNFCGWNVNQVVASVSPG